MNPFVIAIVRFRMFALIPIVLDQLVQTGDIIERESSLCVDLYFLE